MIEYVDLYDENKKLTGEVITREKGNKAIPPEGKYTIVVLAIITDSNGNILLQKTSKNKKGLYALPGGHVISGQTSFEGIKTELKEEMNLSIYINEVYNIKTYKYENAFKDVYYINKDVNVDDLILQEEEVEQVKFFSKSQILEMIDKDKIRKTNIDALNDYFIKNMQ